MNKIMIVLALIGMSVFLNSCKTEEELNKETQHILTEGIRAFQTNDLFLAETKFNAILEEYAEYDTAGIAQNYLDSIPERRSWKSARDSKSIVQLESFLTNFPNSKFKETAGNEIKRLKVQKELDDWESALSTNSISDLENFMDTYPNSSKNARAKSRIKEIKNENKKKAYDNAMAQQSSNIWTRFLEDYPNHSKRNWIKKKIIELEVDEILGDSRTGKMPQAQKTGYSSSTSIRVNNQTGCELTVRYSGRDIKSISIPKGGTRTVYLRSGNYKIAASACGEHYGNTSNLSGSYSSRFYIRTTTY